jgi:hypothetical protein
MFQVELKATFVERYCPRARGWKVWVHVDASEKGLTGGNRTTEKSKVTQREMKERALTAVAAMGSQVDFLRSKNPWSNTDQEIKALGLHVPGLRDIVAFHRKERILLIAEVEGDSSGQPEQKLAKAIGQIVWTVGETQCKELKRKCFVVVAQGVKMRKHLEHAKELEKLGVSGLCMGDGAEEDEWIFGKSFVDGLP